LDPQVGGKGVFDTLEDTDSPECLKRLEDLQKISRDSAAASFRRAGSISRPSSGPRRKVITISGLKPGICINFTQLLFLSLYTVYSKFL
jgi:hypothetical protein